MTRRSFLFASAAAGLTAATTDPAVDAHIHLFASDQTRFPYHANATYRPEASDFEDYNAFVGQSSLRSTVIVHPEPYQDDHSYLLHCFANEPRPGFFKGTCLFDPADPATPERIQKLMGSAPGRIVALRIHAMSPPGEKPLSAGPIKNRDLSDPQVEKTWRSAGELGLAIQMHFLPHHAPAIAKLVERNPQVPVVLDHLGRAGMGSDDDVDAVVDLSRFRNAYLKFSGVRYSSKQDWPYEDAKPLVRRFFDAYGPDRILAGGFGHSVEEFERAQELIDQHFDYATTGDRAAIRNGTASRLFHLQ